MEGCKLFDSEWRVPLYINILKDQCLDGRPYGKAIKNAKSELRICDIFY